MSFHAGYPPAPPCQSWGGTSVYLFLTLLALLLLAPANACAQGLQNLYVDQHVFCPAPTIGVCFRVMGGNGWTIDWMKITVDGVEADATLNQYNYTGTLNWDASQAANPSEHHSSARAQISRPYPPYGRITMQLSSLNPSPQGDGHTADFIVADLKLKSLKYNSPITLLYHAPPLAGYEVPVPQLTWAEDGTMTGNYPAAYVRNTKPNFTIELYPTTGNATTGFDLFIEAAPNLVLYQTAGVQAASFPVTLTAQNPLYNFVTTYNPAIHYLDLYVQFSRTGYWQKVGLTYQCPISRLYAVLDTPSEPMTQPWVPVLDYACSWAAGAADAEGATRLLTEWTYLNCTYNTGLFADTNFDTATNTSEEFYLLDFLNGTNRPEAGVLMGQCNDFADFLVCLSNAIGAECLAAQRSADWADIRNQVLHDGGWCYFWTKPLTLSHDTNAGDAKALWWQYHQWTDDEGVENGKVYDGCIRFGGTTTPEAMSLTDYVSSLLDNTRPSSRFGPQPGFIPTILNNRP
jgi:hypothetical protein